MITSFLNSVSLQSVSGINSATGLPANIAFIEGIGAAPEILYNFPTTTLSNTYTLLYIAIGEDENGTLIRIDKSYSGQQLGVIFQDRTSFLFTYTSGGDGSGSVVSTANYYDNVGPVQRRLVQGYEA
jgi:hypothetical protein